MFNPKNGDCAIFCGKSISCIARLHMPLWFKGKDICLRHQGSRIQILLETKRIKVQFELMTPGVTDRCSDP